MQHTIVRHAHGVALAVGVLAALALVLEVAGGGTGLHGLTGVLVVVGLAGVAAGTLHVAGDATTQREGRAAYRFAAAAVLVGAAAIAIGVLAGI